MNNSQKQLLLIVSISICAAFGVHYYVSSNTENKLDTLLAHRNTRIAKNKESIDHLLQLGMELHKERKFEEAKKVFERGLGINPNHAQTLYALGNSLMELGLANQAFQRYTKILSFAPNAANIHVAAGKALERQNKIKEALQYYEKAIELDPNNPFAHVSAAGMLWALGDLKRGFKEYEWRWVNSNMAKIPKWDGSDLNGKTIYLLGEAGLGDNIQFIRFGRELKKRGAKVVMQVPKPLVNITKQCDYLDEVVTPGQRPSIPFDAVTSMQSVPTNIDTDVETIPNTPYMYADPTLVEYWKQQLAHDKNFKVGLCWMPGGNKYGHVPQGKRQIPLNMLVELTEIPGVSFYSLQKFDGVEQLKAIPTHFAVHDFGEDFDNSHGAFMDTAAIMQNLDLIITIDTSVAHLAGALAVPTWTLLPFHPDPRWMQDRSDCPWYGTMKLFRAPKPYDWDSVVKQVKAELKTLVSHHTKTL